MIRALASGMYYGLLVNLFVIWPLALFVTRNDVRF